MREEGGRNGGMWTKRMRDERMAKKKKRREQREKSKKEQEESGQPARFKPTLCLSCSLFLALGVARSHFLVSLYCCL
jgi:hypothetical protein